MKIIDLIQGSQEWLEFRKKHIGASDAGTIMRLNPYNSRLALWEEKTLGLQKEVNHHMKRGTTLEPAARLAYEMATGISVQPMVAEDDLFPFLSASFDGVTKELDRAVEIKCGRSSHELALSGQIPPYYVAQLQHQMMVAGLAEIDYWSFDGSFGILLKVERDNEFISEMLDAEIAFWQNIVNFEPPED